MNQTHFVVVILIVAGFVSLPKSHAETATEFTFSTYVKTERMRACAESPIAICDEDIDKLALVAEQLDAQEKIAEAFDKSGEKEKALEMRRQIVANAVMLDFCLDSLIVLHKEK
jgi:hypothetical protein